ncbi:MAG TPA: hypothetical protein VIK91_08865 [Nannocystis sp.]|jgi:hypothetical protein
MRSKWTASLILPLLLAGVAACEVEEEQPAQLPEVQVEEGQLPEYRTEPRDVEIGRDTVTVPDVQLQEPTQSR